MYVPSATRGHSVSSSAPATPHGGHVVVQPRHSHHSSGNSGPLPTNPYVSPSAAASPYYQTSYATPPPASAAQTVITTTYSNTPTSSTVTQVTTYTPQATPVVYTTHTAATAVLPPPSVRVAAGVYVPAPVPAPRLARGAPLPAQSPSSQYSRQHCSPHHPAG